LTVAVVGALFAISFDTISQSALFALTAAQFGGVEHAIFLGLMFVAGMLVTDGINGLWISRLIARADQLACIASRVMSLAVSGVSLLVAGFGAAARFAHDRSVVRWQGTDVRGGRRRGHRNQFHGRRDGRSLASAPGLGCF
jgi:hypothetical protein